MNDLREAAEMALEGLETIKSSCREGRTAHAENEAAIVEFLLRQALAQPEKPSTGNVLMDAYNDTIAKKKPPVKSYCGGIANYCTPVDAVNMTQDRVDETAKGEHEWVGLTDEEIKDIIFADDTEFGLKTYSASDWAKIKRTENLLREKNVPQP